MSGSSLLPETLAQAIEDAKADGFTVERSGPKTLLCDLDTEQAQAQFHRVLPVVQEHFGAGEPEFWLSKSGNLHALVPLRRRLDVKTRYALQAALGSDGVREVLNFAQLANGCEEPSILFRPPATPLTPRPAEPVDLEDLV